MSYVYWAPSEDEAIRDRYTELGAAGVARLLPGRSPDSVRARAQRLGVAPPRPAPRRFDAGEDAMIARRYPTLGAKGMADAGLLPGRDVRAIRARASALGVRYGVPCGHGPGAPEAAAPRLWGAGEDRAVLALARAMARDPRRWQLRRCARLFGVSDGEMAEHMREVIRDASPQTPREPPSGPVWLGPHSD